jgi:hypothetical protein
VVVALADGVQEHLTPSPLVEGVDGQGDAFLAIPISVSNFGDYPETFKQIAMYEWQG